MILTSVDSTETNSTFAEKSFTIKQSPIAFEILSSKLYSNPILAIVRELLCNAYDSHVVAGTTDIPIDVTFPNNLENTFIIRDYGTGLSKEDVLELYTTFFDSTKSNSNTLTGGFGLGSKTPFAYSPSFAVTSYYNGVEYNFLATKKDGYPSIIEIGNKPTDEHNGLKISIPVIDSKGSFYNECCNFLKYIPEIKINSNLDIIFNRLALFNIDNINVYHKDNNNSYYHSVYIKQGQNVYSVTSPNNILSILFKEYSYSSLYALSNYFTLVIEVPIGTLPITPSREALSIENIEPINNVIKSVNDIISNSTNYVIEQLSILKASNNLLNEDEESLLVSLINDKYFKDINDKGFLLNTSYYIKKYSKFIYRSPLYLNKINKDYDSSLDCDIYSDKKTYIIFDSSFKKHKTNYIIKKIIKQYNELYNSNILVLQLDKFLIKNNRYGNSEETNKLPTLNTIRWIKNLAFKLNSLNMLNFNVECVFFKEFINRFPITKEDDSEEKEKIIRNITWKSIELTPEKIYMNNCYSLPVKDIKKQLSVDNSILITTNNDKCDFDSFEVFLSYLYKNKNINILKYLKELFNINKNNIYLFTVSKSNLKHFKKYYTLDTNDLYEYLDNINFKFYEFNNNTIYKLSRKFDEKNEVNTLLSNSKIFKLKELNAIKNTLWYKKHTLRIKHYKNILENSLILSNSSLQYIQKIFIDFNKYKSSIDKVIYYNINIKDETIYNLFSSLSSSSSWYKKSIKNQILKNLFGGK